MNAPAPPIRPDQTVTLLDEMLAGGVPVDARQARDPWTMLLASSHNTLLRAFGDAQAITRGPAIQARCLECGMATSHRPAQADTLLQQLLPVIAK